MAQAQRLCPGSVAQRRALLKILHIIAPSPAGGAERVVEALAVGHHRHGHELAVATILFDDTPHPLVETLRAAGVPVHEVRVAPRAYFGERRAVRALCRSIRPDIVHTHGYRSDILDRGVAARLRIATVTTVHGPSMNGGLKGAVYERMQRANYRLFDAVVAVSTALRDISLADGVSGNRIHLIPNAWAALRPPLTRSEARRELGLDQSAAVIGWVGRMIPVKGGDIFLEALHRVPEPRPTAAMIGHGSEAEPLRRQAHELGLDGIVRFYPNVMEAARLFPAFDVFVLSSRSEGLPVVLLEAMAAEVPIVAFRVGGVPEAVGESEALLAPPDDPRALAAAIRQALHDRKAACDRAKRASVRLRQEFAFAPWLERYEAVYRSLLQA